MKMRGFTIVELLVVIVVIAILAAISIVAYNGIQERAYNSKTLAGARNWVSGLQLYTSQKSDFPPQTGPGAWGCLGTLAQYPATANLQAGECFKSSGSTNTVAVGQPLMADITATSIVGIPSSGDIYKDEVKMQYGSDIRYVRGYSVYTYQPTKTVKISYGLKGDGQVCRNGDKDTSLLNDGIKDGITFCIEDITP